MSLHDGNTDHYQCSSQNPIDFMHRFKFCAAGYINITSIMKRKGRSGEQCLAASKEVANKEVASKEESKKWVIGCISKQFAYPNHRILSSSCKAIQKGTP